MTAKILKLRNAPARLECSSCGAAADASCECGKPYVPAGLRAAEAVAANPEKSDRAIADEIGVSDTTVLRARKKSTASCEAVDDDAGLGKDEEAAPPAPVEKRIGKDGKTRKLPSRREPEAEDDPGIEDDIDREDPENIRTAFLLRADQAIHFAAYSGPVTHDLIAIAKRVVAVWSKLTKQMEDTI